MAEWKERETEKKSQNLTYWNSKGFDTIKTFIDMYSLLFVLIKIQLYRQIQNLRDKFYVDKLTFKILIIF